MVDTAHVILFDTPIGAVKWDSNYGIAQFEYFPSFLGMGLEPSPLMMPVRPGRVYNFSGLDKTTFMGLPGMLADALPDTYGRAMFDKWLALTGRTSNTPIESLCYLGKRCMGALEFEPVTYSPTNHTTQFEIDTLVEVAKSALDEKSNFTTNLHEDKKTAIAEILQLGTSAGGQRAKALIAYNTSTGEVRSGQIEAPIGFDYYLIKLDGVSAQIGLKETGNFGRLEYSFYKLAKACGIDMTTCSLIEENGRAHFLTQRFDRKAGKKVHMQTLCGMAHFDYRLRHGYSYEQAFNVMRQLRLPYTQAHEMFLRTVFNVVIRNQDDHTKNISFLMEEDGRWKLSPAYDIGYAYNPQGQWTATHQMSINGKYDNITRADLLNLADINNIKDADSIIDSVCQTASKWPDIAKDCGVPQSIVEEILPNLLLNI